MEPTQKRVYKGYLRRRTSECPHSPHTMSTVQALLDVCAEIMGTRVEHDANEATSLFDLGLTESQLPLLCRKIKEETGVVVRIEDILATNDI